MVGFQRKSTSRDSNGETPSQGGLQVIHNSSKEGTDLAKGPRSTDLPTHRLNHKRCAVVIHSDGESGRSWIHPWHFLRICFRSSSYASCAVNILWPFVPAAIALNHTRPDLHLVIFSLNYIGMIPCANLVGFAGQELARKLPRVVGILLGTTLGSIVEIVLFMVLLTREQYVVIKAAIVGSILSTMLLCLGMCFFVGGLWREEQSFDESVGEVGNGLLLTAGFGLIIPAAFYNTLNGKIALADLSSDVLSISRITSILLITAYAVYFYFNMHTHHSIYLKLFTAEEEADEGREVDLSKDKLTFTECILALVIALTLVSLTAISLVEEIPSIVHAQGVSETFLGLILVPLVEKLAEHLTAIDKAWDNTMNVALSHVLGATIQTALLNAPLVVLVGWALGKDMDLNFEVFTIVIVILAILVVGNFLRDQKSNYLEGALSVIVYVIIAVATYYFPNIASNDS